MKVRFRKLTVDAVVPVKAHRSDAGFDLTSTSRVFDKEGNVTYGFGLALEIPKGYVGLIFPRSSIARKDLALSNAVGVIDSSYRGEIKAKFKPTLLYVDKDGVGKNDTDYEGSDQIDIKTQEVTFHGRRKNYPDVGKGRLPFMPRTYEVGERIAQLIIMPYPEVEFVEAYELSGSDRGEGGFGSTGK